jgi:uncharacterized repeat protein (TIGR01451 family)
LFQNERLQADIAAILRQADYRGDVVDFRQAAATAEIREISLPPGTRLGAMSSRDQGTPVLLKDVLWAGKKPIEAYEFTFTSQDRTYRVVTPKLCSNFWIEPFAPELQPGLEVVKSAPPEASRCQPFETRIAVRNTGKRVIHQVRVTDALPTGWKTPDGRTALVWEVGTLDPATERELRFFVAAASTGSFTNTVQVASANGGTLEIGAVTVIRAPALALGCAAPTEVFAGRPAAVCLTVTNTGDAPEPKVTVTLPIPAGAAVANTTEGGVQAGGRVTWAIANLAPQASGKLCASFTLPQPGSLPFRAEALGTCAAAVQTQCATRVAGIPAILVELVDAEDPIEVGQLVKYNIRVTNQGSAVGTNLKVLCTLDEGQEFLEGSGASPVKAQGRAVTMEPMAAFDPKAVASWQVVVKTTAARDARFKAEVTSDQFPRPVEEFESTEQY